MKKIALFISCCLLALTSCEIDNYDAPDASIHGSILDEVTNELIGSDIQECGLTVVEHGFTNPENQGWKIKNTGEYRNDMVFSGTYDMRYENGNCYPFSEKDVVVKRGDNTKDFKAIPYIRIKNADIKKNGNTITATFSIEGGKSEVKVKELQLFAFSDMWVAHSIRFSLMSGTDALVFGEAETIDPSRVYTLTIDLEKDKAYFPYTGKSYYFRVGALASVSGVGTVRYNYSPLVEIPF